MIRQLPSKSDSGQGALEYLLLIGGAVLVSTIILVIAIGGIFPSTGNIINDNIDAYTQHISVNSALSGGGGGPPVTCGNAALDAGEDCDGALLGGDDCTTISGGFTGGTLGCTASCTFDTSACTLPPGAPSIAGFSADATGTDLGQASVAYSVTGTYTNGRICAYTNGAAVINGPDLGGFNLDCLAAGATASTIYSGVPSSGPFLGTGMNGNTPYYFAMIACNTPVSCSVVTTGATTTTTRPMSDFFSFDWDTMQPVSFNGVAGMSTPSQVMDVTVSNSAGSSLVVSSITPLFSSSANLTDVQSTSGSIYSGSPVGSGTPAVVTYSFSGSDQLDFTYDAAVHQNASTIRYQFNFSDGSTSTIAQVPTLNVALVPETAFFTCNGILEAAGITGRMGTDLTAGGNDRGLAQQFTMPSGTIQYASAEYYISGSGGVPDDSGYFNVMSAWNAFQQCDDGDIDDIPDTGVGFGSATQYIVPINPSGTVVAYHNFDVESFLVPGGVQQWVLTGGPDAGGVSIFRQMNTTGNVSNKPQLWVAYT